MSTVEQTERDHLAEAVRLLEQAHFKLAGVVDDRRQVAEVEVGSYDVHALLDAAEQQAIAATPGAAWRWRSALTMSTVTLDAFAAVVRFVGRMDADR